jgi:hypothetical protein
LCWLSILTVGIFAAQSAIEEPHLSPHDVVPEAETSQPQPVLPLSRLDAFEFSDRVVAAGVMRVRFEDLPDARVKCCQFVVTPEELADEPFEMGCCVTEKGGVICASAAPA